jgi:2-phosphoglycerate kinase
MSAAERSWEVLIVGGPSGVGKTSLSYPLARRFGVAICEIDDLHQAIQQVTTPEQQPAIHYWRTHPEAAVELSAEQIIERHMDVSRALAPAVRAVIANHLAERVPLVLEGDFVLPELVAGAGDRVRGVFLYEPDEGVIVSNFGAREPHEGVQSKRAHVGRLLGELLRDECKRLGVPAVEARPWDTVVDRVMAAVS